MTEADLVPVGPGMDADEPDAIETTDAKEVEMDEERGDDESDREGASVAEIEALLFVAEKPLTRSELRSICRLSSDEVDERLGDLEVQLGERGIRLVSTGERVMLATAPSAGPLIARYLGADTVRLSPAALETLAIVAYRQPATRGVIERIRGVDSGHVVRGLQHRRLIAEVGRAATPGRPILYATTMEFMERFGLTSLDDLPPIEAEIAARLAEAEMEAAEGDDDTTDSDATDDATGSETADDEGEADHDDAGSVDDDG